MTTGGRTPDAAELAEDLAEIKRMLHDGNRDTRQSFVDLTRTIEATYVRKDVYASDQRESERRVSRVEERNTWAFRTALTAFVLPLLVLIVGALWLSGGTP